MVGFGRYPKHDTDYQKFYCTQVALAKQRISQFPLTNKLFDNFKNDESLNYKQNKNKIFLTCIQHIESIDSKFFYGNDKNTPPHLESVKYLIDHSGYPYSIESLENSLSNFDVFQWNEKQYTVFKNRITSHDHDTSDSAFSEITTAFRIGTKIGLNNVQYEPSIPNGKNSDIRVCLNGRDIYLELSSITESKPNKKIQSILDDVAKYLFCKVKTNSFFHFEIWIDTTKLIHTDGHIDEEKSKKLLSDWIDKLHIHELVGCNELLYLTDYRSHSGIMEYSQKSLIDYPWHRPFMKELFKQHIINNWASKITVADTVLSPFVSISCSDKVTSSSVTIHEDAMHSTHEELVNSNKFSDIQTGKMQEDSFFNQISRKILYKINEEQYKRGTPVIFVIYGELWSNSYETDSDDFSKIETIVKKVLNPHPHISGVLLYHTDYTNGKFIHNPNADPNIKITDSESSLLFS